MVTAGPGVTNTVTEFNASLLCVSYRGCNPTPMNGGTARYPHIEILKPITRYSRTARV